MKIYLKGFYWYKNFWDEVLLFWLLNYLQKEYNPDEIVVEVWSIEWIQSWLNKNKEYLQDWIIDKLDFVENKEISKRFRQILSFFGINKYKKYFKVFGWWEVLDESRNFPHDGWNLILLHHYNIRKWKFILVWWIGTNKKFKTKRLFKYILHRAQKIICREKISYERVIKNWWKSTILYEDFSKQIFQDSFSQRLLKWQNNNILINISPKYFNKKNIEKIKNFVWKYSSDCKKIFFPADINIDKELFTKIRKDIPDLEIYDRTKHNLKDSIELFSDCIWWIWSRLHFLYPLKIFNKDFESISDSDKVAKIILNVVKSSKAGKN